MQQTYSGSFFAFLRISIFAHPEEDLREEKNTLSHSGSRYFWSLRHTDMQRPGFMQTEQREDSWTDRKTPKRG